MHPDFELLAAYNAEVARGIVHTPEWDERMTRLQAEYDDVMAIAATRAAGETLKRMAAEVNVEPKPDAFIISAHKPSWVDSGFGDTLMLQAAPGMTPDQIRGFQDDLNNAAGGRGWDRKFVIIPAGSRVS
jgi:hypothetical protein